MNRGQQTLLTIGVTSVVTAAVTAFARNFISGEKKITRRVARRYGIADPPKGAPENMAKHSRAPSGAPLRFLIGPGGSPSRTRFTTG